MRNVIIAIALSAVAFTASAGGSYRYELPQGKQLAIDVKAGAAGGSSVVTKNYGSAGASQRTDVRIDGHLTNRMDHAHMAGRSNSSSRVRSEGYGSSANAGGGSWASQSVNGLIQDKPSYFYPVGAKNGVVGSSSVGSGADSSSTNYGSARHGSEAGFHVDANTDIDVFDTGYGETRFGADWDGDAWGSSYASGGGYGTGGTGAGAGYSLELQAWDGTDYGYFTTPDPIPAVKESENVVDNDDCDADCKIKQDAL